jgi:PPOX class probable F420-dependent enzyme
VRDKAQLVNDLREALDAAVDFCAAQGVTIVAIEEAPAYDAPRNTTRQVENNMIKMPDELLALLRGRSTCYIATVMPDGSPQMTQTWVDTDGERIVINTVQGYVKVKNVERDPRVAVAIASPDNPSRYFQVRGRVVNVTTEGAVDHINQLSQKYIGAPYPWYGGRNQVRVIVTIAPEKITSMG